MLDFTDLQNEVIDHWENEGTAYFTHDTQSGSNIPAGGFTQTFIKPEYANILDDPMACIDALGYNSISEYIREAAC